MDRKKIEKIKNAAEEFAQEYMFKKPYSNYVNSCGITKRALVEWKRRGTEKNSLEEVIKKMRKAGKNPDEFCISVGLRKPLPKHLSLPKVYKGFKVHVEVRGEMELY